MALSSQWQNRLTESVGVAVQEDYLSIAKLDPCRYGQCRSESGAVNLRLRIAHEGQKRMICTSEATCGVGPANVHSVKSKRCTSNAT